MYYNFNHFNVEPRKLRPNRIQVIKIIKMFENKNPHNCIYKK